MSKMKRIFAVLLTLAMVLGMSVVTFAALSRPNKTNAEKVSITGVEDGATYAAYQIIDAKYDDNGFVGYIWAAGINETGFKAGDKVTFSKGSEGEDVVNGLTEELITKLAADSSKLTEKKVPFTTDTALEAGTWMILVTPPAANPTKIYNPMIVSVFYKVTGSGSSNELETGAIDAAENWTLDATDAFAKSSDITLSKELENVSEDTMVKVGDQVPFVITSTIPSYDSAYYKYNDSNTNSDDDPKFEISDTIVNGLKYIAEPKVYLGGTSAVSAQAPTEATELTKGTDYDLTYNETKGFTIKFKFTSDIIKNLANKTPEERAVTVKYSAEVTEAAVTKVGENKATLTFSTTPAATSTKNDTEYVFTFGINDIFQKVDEAKKPLPNATFTLYVEDNVDGKETIKWAENETKKVSTVTNCLTEEDCDIQFKGLDGDKVYYLKETAAPEGYSINDIVYKVEFEFSKPENYAGEDTAYTVKITDNKGGESKSYTVSYGTKAEDSFGNEAQEDATPIINTKLSALPSTGGIGTTIFTITGCLIMIAAAGLFFASRRKSEK